MLYPFAKAKPVKVMNSIPGYIGPVPAVAWYQPPVYAYPTIPWVPTYAPPFAPAPTPLPARRRKFAKRLPEPIQINPYTLQPVLPDGIHEIYREKLGNKFARHYGVAVTRGGYTRVTDLRHEEGTRTLTIEEFLEGRAGFVGKSVPPGPEMYRAIERLDEAKVEYAKWDLLANNCQHFSSYVVSGKRSSEQINMAGMLAGLAVVVVLASASRAG